ncbi:MAG: c-type cytochrome [Thiobacillus sp.]|nr:c-type cytochrome [Thiobacillus sp.]
MPNWFSKWLENQKHTRAFHPSWILLVVATTIIIAGIVWIPAALVSKAEYDRLPSAALPASEKTSAPTGEIPAAVEQPGFPAPTGPKTIRVDFSPPDVGDLPSGEFGEAVRLGRNIFNDTQTYARAYVGNGLNCVNCHLDEGRKANSAPLWAAYVMFPAYREKNSRVNSYEDRLTGCFRFSMNGKVPPPGSKELIALMSYSYWLSKGAPVGVELAGRGYPKLAEPQQPPDAARGKKVFEANCAICHGADGQGTQVSGRYAFPPLWGKDSFNAGAGMTQVHNAAAFIRANMPLGQGNTLTEQEAWDVAKYMNSHGRPVDPRLVKS